MPRPRKTRNVSCAPEVAVYKPAGVPARFLNWTTLSLDEYEAIRQIDHEGLDQDTVAQNMGVSRPTVTRIYRSARKKIADFLVLGQALKIEGGPVCEENMQHKPRCCGKGKLRRKSQGSEE